MRGSILLSFFLVVVVLCYNGAFGQSLENPNYSVLQRLASNIEIRRYDESKWVATSVEAQARNSRSSSNSMFYKLFDYISGKNSQNKKIAMTAPVTTIFKNSDNSLITPDSRCEMSMRFYIPREFHQNTPQPTGDAFLQTDAETVVASIQFGGFASMNDNIKYRDLLIKALGTEARRYDTVNMMTAGYDSPFKLIGRRNEVWLKRID